MNVKNVKVTVSLDALFERSQKCGPNFLRGTAFVIPE
jgi:hypothetical protein